MATGKERHNYHLANRLLTVYLVAIVLILSACNDGTAPLQATIPTTTPPQTTTTTPPVTTTPTPTPTPTSTPTPTPTPEIPPSGIGTASVEIAGNPGDLPVLISGPLELAWDIIDSTIAIRGFPGIGVLTGPPEEDGTFSARGYGDYFDYSVEVIFNGIITPEGISGMLIVGSGGALPCCGQPISFDIALLFT